ncbi:MAG: redoxin domain-containing protein [Bacteroidota bacterium]
MKSVCNLSFILVLFCATIPNVYSQKTGLSEYDSLGTMPPFEYYTLSGEAFTPHDLSSTRKTVFIYFKNDCPYCQRQGSIIADHMADFASADFVFITRQDSALAQEYATAHHLQNLANVKLVLDKKRLYYSYCKAQYTPSIHIYDKHKKLIKFTEGVLKRDDLMNYLN